MIFTMTYQANMHPRTHVVLEEYKNLKAAIAHALERKRSAPNQVTRVLIREGDAYPTDPIVWDSNTVSTPAVDATADAQRKRKAKTRRLLKSYDEAHDEYLFKGTRFHTEHAAIIARYKRARKLLLEHIDEV